MTINLRRNGDVVPSITLTDNNVNWALGNCFSKTISAATTFSFSNAGDGQVIVVRVINNTAGALALTWPGAVVNPDIIISANKTRLFTFMAFGALVYNSSVEI